MYNTNLPEFQSLFEVYNNLLLEASKLKVLKDKLKLDDQSAEFFDENFGGAAVIIANKFLDYIKEAWPRSNAWEIDPETGKREIIHVLRSYSQQLISIRDWIRVGLNGNINQHKKKSLNDLIKLAQEWHASLEAGEGQTNYQEDGFIIRDYRKNGIGFYWVDLETNDSKEECDRMGHCGRTSHGNTILSLREYKTASGGSHTTNVSHLTMALGKDDGIIYQLKGPKNSHPKKEYHQYIVDLILTHTDIKGFGSEYASKEDFSFLDLTPEDIKKIYKARPELFSRRKEKMALVNAGLLDEKELKGLLNPEFVLELWQDEWTDWFRSDSGNMSLDYAVKILDGEDDDYGYYWDSIPDFNGLWDLAKGSTQEYFREKIQEKIKELSEDDKEEISLLMEEDDHLEELIETLNLDYEIITPLRDAYAHSLEEIVSENIMGAFRDAFGELGSLQSFQREETTRVLGRTYNQRNGTFKRETVYYLVARIKVKLFDLMEEEDYEEIIVNGEFVENDYEGILQEYINYYGNPIEVNLRNIFDYIYVTSGTFNKHLDYLI